MCKQLFIIVLLIFCGLSAKAQQLVDTVHFKLSPTFADTAAIAIDIEDFLPTRLSDEELRIFIMRVLHHGSPEASMLNDPFFAPGERFYGLFNEHRPPQIPDELSAIKLIREQLERERGYAKKAAAAGAVYWWLQWLLIFL
jgi:hypothetical protein